MEENEAKKEEAGKEREKALKFWNVICGLNTVNRDVIVSMHQNTIVKAKLDCTDGKQSMFGVSQLETPLGVYPNAQLRRNDILHIEMKLSLQELEQLYSTPSDRIL